MKHTLAIVPELAELLGDHLYWFDQSLSENDPRCPFLSYPLNDAHQHNVRLQLLLDTQQEILDILHPRLNQIHQVEFSREFWFKSMGMGFQFLLSMLADTWDRIKLAQQQLMDMTIPVLSDSHFVIPIDFDHSRWFFESDPIGRQQLISLVAKFSLNSKQCPQYTTSAVVKSYRIRNYSSPSSENPKLGIMGAWFSASNLQTLQSKLGSDIGRIGIDRGFDRRGVAIYDDQMDLAKRGHLFAHCDSLSPLAQLFFYCGIWIFPRSHVECFQGVYADISMQLTHYSRLKWLVSEIMVGDCWEMMCIAILSLKGVKSIYHEHNCTEFMFVNSMVDRWAMFADIYLAHGIHGHSIPHGIAAGSLSDWSRPNPKEARKGTWFHSVCFTHAYSNQGSDRIAGNGVYYPELQKMRLEFLNKLPKRILSELYFRGYPIDDFLKYATSFWPQKIYEPYQKVMPMDSLNLTGKEAIVSSSINVLSYYGTPFLESMSLNQPVVCLFSFRLDEIHESYRELITELMNVGILQNNGERAADFLISIWENPTAWWQQNKVQKIRQNFVDMCLGNPELALQTFIKLAKE